MAISKSIAVKEVLLFFSFLFSAFFLNAQNVGIGTTTPQATLDVKGNLRTGGNSNFISYDSLSGKIIWTNSNLWVTNPQYLMKHSASAEGLYSNGSQLEYRNSTGNPIFFTNWSNGNGYFSGNLGIGTVSPTAKLQIRDGASGITPFFSARMIVETNDHTYINLLSPDAFETGILFGSGTNAASGVISYNTTTTPKGFTFSDNGNLTRMVINNSGNVGIGTTNPQRNLSVQNGMNIDQADGNTGSAINAITFGNNSGEGIGSKRNAGGNQWGLDFYTGSANRMSITNGGNVGIGTTSPAATLEVNGYSKLGSNAPSIKMLKLTGTTAATDGGYVDIPHGLDPSKILSVSAIVQISGSVFIGEGDAIFSGSKFYWAVFGSNIRIFNLLGDSASILSKPAKILITYEE